MIIPPIMLGVVSSLRGSSRFPAIFRLLGINTEQPSNVWDRQLKSTIVMWPGHIYGYINYVCTVYNYVYIYIIYIYIYCIPWSALSSVVWASQNGNGNDHPPNGDSSASNVSSSSWLSPAKYPSISHENTMKIRPAMNINEPYPTNDWPCHGTTHCIVPGNRFGTDPERDAQFDDDPLKLEDEITCLGPFIP